MRGLSKVWAVIDYDYENTRVRAIFNNKHAADVSAAINYSQVEEWEVGSEAPEHETYFHTSLQLDWPEPQFRESYRRKGKDEPAYSSDKKYVSFEDIRVPYFIQAWGCGNKQRFLDEFEKEVTSAELLWIQLGIKPKDWKKTLAEGTEGTEGDPNVKIHLGGT